MFFKFVFGAGDGEGFLAGGHAGFALVQFNEFTEFLAVVFLEFGFVVEEVLGGGGATLEEVNHALGLGRGLGIWAGFGSKVIAEHGSEGGNADAGSGFPKEVAAVDEKLGFGEGVEHGDFRLLVWRSRRQDVGMKLHCLESGLLLEKGGECHEVENELLKRLFQSGKGEIEEILNTTEVGVVSGTEGKILPPVPADTEIWAAGVTYMRSKSARMEESEKAGGDVFYDLVYDAERPELFFKSMGYRAVGNGAEIRVREDSSWDVPEPELTLAVNAGGEIFGFTVGNDVSSRSIEGENPLYLPQAKVYNGSCAVGPCLLLGRDALKDDAFIKLTITRSGEAVFDDATDLTQLKRGLEELVEALYRELDFPNGAMMMTGTGVVPGTDFTLQTGDVVRIEIEGIGTLENVVA